jgi:HCOMODA/2-hydroxy-3-carboxy-muconic semialdehyde decarboxylase
VFDIRQVAGMTALLIGNGVLGKALGVTLGQGAVALLRGHGNVVVGDTVQEVVYGANPDRTQCPAAALSGDVRRAADLPVTRRKPRR